MSLKKRWMLFDDYHAARVLPGFDVNGKILLLEKLKEKTEIIKGCLEIGAVEKLEIIIKQLEISPEYGLAVKPAKEKSRQNNCPAMALILYDGYVITGKTTNILTAASSLVLNCVKKLAEFCLI